MIKNLVFSGGGVKGYSFIGCLKALEELNITQEIKAISSTSIGSLFSILLMLRIKSVQRFIPVAICFSTVLSLRLN